MITANEIIVIVAIVAFVVLMIRIGLKNFDEHRN